MGVCGRLRVHVSVTVCVCVGLFLGFFWHPPVCVCVGEREPETVVVAEMHSGQSVASHVFMTQSFY